MFGIGMFSKIKKLKNISICIFIFFIFIFCFFKYAKRIKNKKNINKIVFSVLLYDLDGTFLNRLEMYIILYDKKNNILKILPINTDIVIDKIEGTLIKQKSIRDIFNTDLINSNSNIAIYNFYINLYKVIGNIKIDFFINSNFKILSDVIYKKYNKKLIFKNNFCFIYDNTNFLIRSDIIDTILNFISLKIFNVYKIYYLFNTNIKKYFFILIYYKMKFFKPNIVFYDFPIKHNKGQIKPNIKNIKKILNSMYFITDINKNINIRNVTIDVKNASCIYNVAKNIAFFLRTNGFDVLDWGNSNAIYDKTLIKNHNGEFKNALKISKILRIGKILVSYDTNIYQNITIFVGKDFIKHKINNVLLNKSV
jgi:hypothetical protein